MTDKIGEDYQDEVFKEPIELATLPLDVDGRHYFTYEKFKELRENPHLNFVLTGGSFKGLYYKKDEPGIVVVDHDGSITDAIPEIRNLYQVLWVK